MLEQMLPYPLLVGGPFTLQEPDIWPGYSILLKAPLTHLGKVHEGCLGICAVWHGGL